MLHIVYERTHGLLLRYGSIRAVAWQESYTYTSPLVADFVAVVYERYSDPDPEYGINYTTVHINYTLTEMYIYNVRRLNCPEGCNHSILR